MIRKTRKTPKYEKIFNQLMREISSNYKIGELFHTQRDLMKQFNASYATIGHVLRKLKAQEIIITHVGKGIFIKNIPGFRTLKAVKIAVFVQNNTGLQDKSIGGLYQAGLLEAQEKLPCEIIFLNRTDNAENMIKQFKVASADGILFLEDSLVKLQDMVKKEGIPYVVVHPIQQKHSFCVDIDDASGIKDAVQEMARKGAEKILFISRFINQGHNSIKTDAYCMGLELAGLPFDKERVIEIFRDDNLVVKLDKLRVRLREKDNYDAILLIDPAYLELIEGALLYEKIKVPEDILLSVFGAYGYAETCLFPLGVVAVPFKEAAMQGLEMLVKRCQGHNPDSDIRLLKTTFSWQDAHVPEHKRK
jgi:DNA-binding LacI/PurR family transcriptional regulator